MPARKSAAAHAAAKTTAVCGSKGRSRAGDRYELVAVGWVAELGELALRMNESGGFRMIDAGIPDHRYHYTYRDTDDGAPARLKPAASAAIEGWPELRAYRDHPDFLHRIRKPYVLWKKIEVPPFYWCPDQCERCDKQRAKFPPVPVAEAPVPVQEPPSRAAVSALANL